jgi:hypothetical protein
MRVCIGLIILAAYFCPWTGSALLGSIGFFKVWTEVPHSLWWWRHWSIAPGMSDYYRTTVHTVNTTWRTTSLIQDFMECAETTPTFLFLIPIFRQFRTIRCNQQPDIHSALFNYTPLVNSGDWQKYAVCIIKPTQTGINRNKYTFWNMKSLEPPENLKTSRVP